MGFVSMRLGNLFDCAEGGGLASARSTLNAENSITAHQNFMYEPELIFVQSRPIPVVDTAGRNRSNRLRLIPSCSHPVDGFALCPDQFRGSVTSCGRMRPDMLHRNEAALLPLPVQLSLDLR